MNYPLQIALERGIEDFNRAVPRDHNPFTIQKLRAAWVEGRDEALYEDNEASARTEENLLRTC